MKLKSIILYLVVSVLALITVASAVLAYLSYINQDPTKGMYFKSYSEKNVEGGELVTEKTNKGPINQDKKTTEEKPAKDLVDCIEDLLCFSKYSATCSPAIVIGTTKFDFFGINITQKIEYEIKELNKKGECVVDVKIVEYSAIYSDGLKEIMKENNKTDEEIKESEAKTNKVTKETINRTGTCYFDNLKEMKEIFLKMHEGTFTGGTSCYENEGGDFECESTGDWENVICTGIAFEPISLA